MSRVGKLPISIPQGVTVDVNDAVISVKGPKGTLEQKNVPGIKIAVENNVATVSRESEDKAVRSLHGTYRSVLQNMVIGVSQGFKKALLINGVGYRAEVSGKSLMLNLGYSNQVEFVIPGDVQIQVENQNKVIVEGVDKVRVGQVSAEIRSIRPPEPYKGKGVRYEDEYVRRKVGKSGIK
jgi:large subunit ribosomal protein L6